MSIDNVRAAAFNHFPIKRFFCSSINLFGKHRPAVPPHVANLDETKTHTGAGFLYSDTVFPIYRDGCSRRTLKFNLQVGPRRDSTCHYLRR